MRRIGSTVYVGVGLVSMMALAACKKEEPPPATPVAPQYPQPGQPGYPQQYPPQPGQPGYEQPGALPAQPGQPGAGQMATPGPTALACQNDSQCITHRCNTQYGKCAFPCVSDNDCIQGTTCLVAAGPAAACVPKPPGAQ